MTLEDEARRLDETDPLPTLRGEFLVPPAPGGPHKEAAYFAGNSLGLQPRSAAVLLREELDDWARLAVEAHTQGRRPWVAYHELLREPAARLVGALPHEVVAMNSLTVNLHLMMASFYRPAGTRTRIVIEDAAFPSDSYAVASQAVHHGLDPAATVVRLRPRDGEDALRTEDVLAFLDREGGTVALVLLGGVNYLTGQLMDMEAITKAGRAAGAVVGWDLAHAAGNVPLRLHDWDVDFAAWCTYKYLNGGPGSPAYLYVHGDLQHRFDSPLPGWHSHADPFAMSPGYAPAEGAVRGRVGTPDILSLLALESALGVWDGVDLAAVRAKSLALGDFFLRCVAAYVPEGAVSSVTPAEPERRGSQISLRRPDPDAGGPTAAEVMDGLIARGIVGDFRRPDILRFGFTPLYTSFLDAERAARVLGEVLG